MVMIYTIFFGAVISVAVAVLAILFAVKCKYRTAKWRGAGARCFWFSLLFIIPTFIFEIVGKLFLDRLSGYTCENFGGNTANFVNALSQLIYYTIFVAGSEEAGKILAVYIGTGGYHRMKSQNEIINYALISAAAFTGLENILYFIGTLGNIATAILRAMISSPFHIMCTLLIAVSVLRSMQENKPGIKFKGIALAILIHGCYDFIAEYVLKMRSNFSYVGTLFMVFMIVAMIFVVINLVKAPRRYAEQNATSTCKLCGTVAPGLARRCSACNATAFTYQVEYPPMIFPKKETPILPYEPGQMQTFAQGWPAAPQSYVTPQATTAQPPVSAQMPNVPQMPSAPYVQAPVTAQPQQPAQMPVQTPNNDSM